VVTLTAIRYSLADGVVIMLHPKEICGGWLWQWAPVDIRSVQRAVSRFIWHRPTVYMCIASPPPQRYCSDKREAAVCF